MISYDHPERVSTQTEKNKGERTEKKKYGNIVLLRTGCGRGSDQRWGHALGRSFDTIPMLPCYLQIDARILGSSYLIPFLFERRPLLIFVLLLRRIR